MKTIIKRIFSSLGFQLIKNIENKYNFIYSKYESFTMIPKHFYYENLRLVELFGTNVEGSIVECGVWRGGMIAGMVEVLGKDRKYHLFDSFQGLPEAKEIDGESATVWQKNKLGEDYHDNCKAEISFAQTAMKNSGGDSYKLYPGWFTNTLPSFDDKEPIAVLRLDGDWYDSTMDCLKYLYPLVNKDGLIIIDDYFTWDGCSKAVHDYLSITKSSSRIFTSSNNVCYIIKNESFSSN